MGQGGGGGAEGTQDIHIWAAARNGICLEYTNKGEESAIFVARWVSCVLEAPVAGVVSVLEVSFLHPQLLSIEQLTWP